MVYFVCSPKKKGIFIMKGKRLIFSLAALTLLFGVVACGNSGGEEGGKSDQPSEQSVPKQEKISVEAEGGKKSLILGQTVQLTAKVGDAVLEGVTWESAKPEIASVDANGLVTSVSKGSASIKAIKEGYKDGSISISVDYETIKVSVAEGGKTSLLVGETVQLNADKQGVTWASSDTAIATVSETGLVTAVKVGSATISASGTNLNSGSQVINVVRPDPTATLHMENADHVSADGVWGTSYGSTMYGPGEESPVYARSSGNASDGTCIAYMDNGDKETLTFTSDKAVKAELVLTMAARSAIEDMSTIMNVKFNAAAIDLAGQAFAGGGDTNTFVEFSLGEVNLINGSNVLEFDFLASSPYMDDLNIYAESNATIAVVLPAPKLDIDITTTEINLEEGATEQIVCATEGVTYASSKETVATVSETGLVTAVAKGTATIHVRKDGYKPVKIAVTVTEKVAEGEIRVEAESAGEVEGIVFRSTSTGETCTSTWSAETVLTVKATIVNAGTYTLILNGRAGGQYGMSNIDDLASVIEVKVNDAVVDVTGVAISGRTFTNYPLGDVTLSAGEVSIAVKALADDVAPNIDFFKLVPKA